MDWQTIKIGLIGGGQLGKMLLQKAYDYNLQIAVLDPSAHAPCADLAASFTTGDWKDYQTVYDFGKTRDVLTIEFEAVNSDALAQLADEGKRVIPEPHALKVIQDKGLQKEFYRDHDIPTAPFFLSSNKEDFISKVDTLGFPVFQKLRKDGYDGYGVKGMTDITDTASAFDAPCMTEKAIAIEKEISVIVARNGHGKVATFPAVEMVFNKEANMVELLRSPAELTAQQESRAGQLAIQIIEKLDMTGILAVEMFLTKAGEILVNEIAPRPHNSGHHTIEANYSSQYDMHIRTLLNWPLGDTQTIQPAAMINILGEKDHQGPAIYEGLETVMQYKGVYVHLYGKREMRPFRKMGHVTVLNPDIEKAIQTARKIKETLKVKA